MSVNHGSVIKIDVGSEEAAKISYEDNKTDIDSICRINTFDQFVELLKNTLPTYPFPMESTTGRQKNSRKMELIRGALSVDELRLCFSSGFRIESTLNEKLESHFPLTQSILLGFNQPFPDDAAVKFLKRRRTLRFLDAILLRCDHIKHAGFFYYRMKESEKAEVEAEVQEIISLIFNTENGAIQPTKLWSMTDGLQSGWFCVGVRENDKKSKVAFLDQENFAVFLVTDEAVVSPLTYFLLQPEQTPNVLESIKTATCTKIPFFYFTPSIRKLEKSSEMHKAMRAAVCGPYHTDADPEFAFGDCCRFETAETIQAIKAAGANILTLIPLAAYRTEYTWNKSNLTFASFFKYMTLCEVKQVLVPNQEMKRIAACILSLDRGNSSFDVVTSYPHLKKQSFPLELMKLE